MSNLPAAWRVLGAGITGFAVLVLVYLVVPTLVIVPLSFSSEPFLSFPPPGLSLRWYEAFAASPDYRIAIVNSIRIGIPAACLATVFGTLAALALVRGRLPGRRALSALMIAPLVLPQIVLAIGLFPVMVRLGLNGSYPAILLGHAVVCMPLVFVTVAASLRSYAPTYELAAMTLGANPWNTFRFVTFPMIRVGVVLGFIFAFTFSFDELILAIFLTSPLTRTVPRLLWEQLNYQMTPLIAAATTVLLALTLGLLVVAALVDRHGARRSRGTLR
ncbi:ABC transporter permease [Labrys wisconsinensis]|uniref:Spermidine/putrescine transport system permease protein n=1 Tax=Labrys wisconsinensis TaxID=425677 RepID=A0ABU0J284_9HYPH|nr:ABC transporter permease [Labrys wisconsinensis]MDQ0468366.1 putative spermidine/putrescine transport system permease protein [Labrys wisconsinensis]